jgi:DDE superfamily endonuclease
MKKPRARKLLTEEQIILYLTTLGGSNEGGIGHVSLGVTFRLSEGTVTNYIHHVSIKVHRVMKEFNPIVWPTAEERAAMQGLLIWFPDVIGFVDGNKTRRWRPKDTIRQKLALDGHKHAYVFSILLWMDIYGFYIHLDFSEVGAKHDRALFNKSHVMQHLDALFIGNEVLMTDMWFTGEGTIVCPFKSGRALHFELRGLWNQMIRKQRMINEWGVGYIRNRHRMFLGRWPYDDHLFPICYESCVMLAYWRFDRRGEALQTLTTYL